MFFVCILQFNLSGLTLAYTEIQNQNSGGDSGGNGKTIATLTDIGPVAKVETAAEPINEQTNSSISASASSIANSAHPEQVTVLNLPLYQDKTNPTTNTTKDSSPGEQTNTVCVTNASESVALNPEQSTASSTLMKTNSEKFNPVKDLAEESEICFLQLVHFFLS